MNLLAPKPVVRKTGREVLTAQGKPTAFDLLSFWQWSGSDLLSNAFRGVLAEYIVAAAFGEVHGVRVEWDAYDLETPAGVRVEVKSGAYLQTWHQDKLSQITFGIRPTYGWDSKTSKISDRQARQADVYVFAILDHKEKATVNPLDLDQWTFYCLATKDLNDGVGNQKTISLTGLLRLKPTQATFATLATIIEETARSRS